ncbi:hypothetical protein EAG_08297 [Camponotus floridanus]|uniref:Uncharacterized protein n=1 Tax=Camponotus floridanus TaxID=104421 RepID=E2APJ8_CAMFO|nr:hypothetical protein EAG_08297 [Camponotus floridanus]
MSKNPTKSSDEEDHRGNPTKSSDEEDHRGAHHEKGRQLSVRRHKKNDRTRLAVSSGEKRTPSIAGEEKTVCIEDFIHLSDCIMYNKTSVFRVCPRDEQNNPAKYPIYMPELCSRVCTRYSAKFVGKDIPGSH